MVLAAGIGLHVDGWEFASFNRQSENTPSLLLKRAPSRYQNTNLLNLWRVV